MILSPKPYLSLLILYLNTLLIHPPGVGPSKLHSAVTRKMLCPSLPRHFLARDLAGSVYFLRDTALLCLLATTKPLALGTIVSRPLAILISS